MDKKTDCTNRAAVVADELLSIGAVFLSPDKPFTWASGIKSPIYCDNRLTLTAPDVRNNIENSLAEIIRTDYPEAEVLMGTSTAGIAHAAITGHILGLPMGYVRSSAKDHGRGNQIEGKLEAGQKVVVVEDLISTGGSVIDVVEALRERGRRCSALSVFLHTECKNQSTGLQMQKLKTSALLISILSFMLRQKKTSLNPGTLQGLLLFAITRQIFHG